MLRYAGEIGAVAHGYAELANRSSVSLSDVVRHPLPPEPSY